MLSNNGNVGGGSVGGFDDGAINEAINDLSNRLALLQKQQDINTRNINEIDTNKTAIQDL